MSNLYEQMRASPCHQADVCTMAASCPFVADCRVIEADAEPEQVVATKHAALITVPTELLDDYDGFDLTDALRRAMNGEAMFKKPTPPKRHRCLFCWLVSLLPGHDRCNHGRLTCYDCRDD